MRKKYFNILAKVLIISAVLTGTVANADKVKIATEQAIAGISVSLDGFADKKTSEDEKTNLATEVAVKADDEAKSDAASDSAVKDDSEDKDAKDEDLSLEVDKDEKNQFKLNLVFDRLGMAKVDTYLNVRKKPSENAKIVGKMTKHSGCNIYNIKKGWAKIVSGDVRGYVNAEYLYKDEAALERAKEVATLRARIKTQTLNVRFLPSTDSRIYDLISGGTGYDLAKLNLNEEWMNKFIEKHAKKKDLKLVNKKEMMEDLDNWACISIDDDLCFINKDYFKVSYRVDRAVKITHHKSKSGGKGSSSSGGNTSIVDYAMQFLGNPYVWGGVSLTNGCDCSGFTMSLYAHYGVSLPHFAASQASCTTSVSSSEARPGDLFFYGDGISHVGMYIGNGQIIHASNSRTGIIISSAYYRTPVKIGRVG